MLDRPVRKRSAPNRYRAESLPRKLSTYKQEKKENNSTSTMATATQTPNALSEGSNQTTTPRTTRIIHSGRDPLAVPQATANPQPQTPIPATIYVPTPQDIPPFIGKPLKNDPPINKDYNSPEFNIQLWLTRIDLFFKANNITSDKGKIQKLLAFANQKVGDARLVIASFLSPTFDHYTYEDVCKELRTTYARPSATEFVYAARALYKKIHL